MMVAQLVCFLFMIFDEFPVSGDSSFVMMDYYNNEHIK